MPTSSNFYFSLDWPTLVGVFNAVINVLSSPIALTIALALGLGVVAFVFSYKPAATKERPQRLKQSKHLADTRIPDRLAQPVNIPPALPEPVTIKPASDDPTEQAIIDRLANGPAHIDDITRDLDLPAYQVSAATTMLELKGVIKSDALNLSLTQVPPPIPAEHTPPTQTAKRDPTAPTRSAKRNYPRMVVALMEWVRGIIGAILGGNERKRSHPNPNLIRPDYVPEIEPPPAKEYVPPIDELSLLLEKSLQEQATIDRLIEDSPAVNRRLANEQPELIRGHIVRVFGADPSRQYDLQYELRDLSDLITSNTGTGAANPEYPAELQPRDRTRAASAMQIGRIAQNLEPDALLNEFLSLDRGAPIIGDDNAVESGNGRVLALRRAAADYPGQYESYRQRLTEIAEERGLNPAHLDNYHQPVLVRRRVSNVDRVAFAQEANSAAILQMSDTEQARSDAKRISPEALYNLEVYDDVDYSLRSPRNREFIRSFVAQLPENERAAIIDREGDLTQSGIRRIKAALFNRVYNDPKLSDRLFESADNDIRNITNGLMGSLGRLAQVEEMVRQGHRPTDLSIANDIAIATEKLANLKEQGLHAHEYLAQGQLFSRELSPAQEQILAALDERRRSGKKVKDLVSEWADIVEAQPNPNQMSFLGDKPPKKEELIERWLKEPAGQLTLV